MKSKLYFLQFRDVFCLLQVKLSGSLLPEVAEASLKSSADKDQLDYSAHSKYGNVAHLNADGKFLEGVGYRDLPNTFTRRQGEDRYK